MNYGVRFMMFLLYIISIGSFVIADEKQSGSADQSHVLTNSEALDLSFLSQDRTYSFAASSTDELKIAPTRYTTNDLIPILIEFRGSKDNEMHHGSQFANIAKTSESTLGSISYSGMFMTASDQWYWGYNQNYNNFLNLMNTRGNEGYRIESIDIYPETDNNSSLYAATWIKDGLWWAWVLNYEANDFISQLNTYKQENRRIIDIEFDKRNRKFAGIWTGDEKGWAWVINYDYDSYLQEFETQKNEDRRPLDMSIYLNADNSAFLYSGVWVSNSEGYGWAWAFNYEWSEFSNLLDQYNSEGKRLIDYEKYVTSAGVYYGGIWVDDDVVGGYSINYNDQTEFSGRIESRKNDDNMRPIKFEMYTDLDIGIKNPKPVQIESFELAQNYPNPFNPNTNISFAIHEDGFLSLKIYDLGGREVMTLLEKEITPGQYRIPFNGEKLTSGIYLYRLELTGEKTYTQTKKMSLIK